MVAKAESVHGPYPALKRGVTISHQESRRIYLGDFVLGLKPHIKNASKPQPEGWGYKMIYHCKSVCNERFSNST